MKPFARILLPVDLADFSPRIVPHVIGLAKQFDADVHLLYVERVLKEQTAGHIPDISAVKKFVDETLKEAEAEMETLVKKYFRTCRVARTKVIMGHAAEEILKYVQQQKIYLVIIGTHGKKGIDRFLFGSVAEKVIQSSPVPVLTLNPYQVSTSKGLFDFSVEGDEELKEELSQYNAE